MTQGSTLTLSRGTKACTEERQWQGLVSSQGSGLSACLGQEAIARRRTSFTGQRHEGVPRKGETLARRRISVTRQRLEGVPRK